MNLKEIAPRFDEIRANAKAIGEDKSLAAIAMFSMLMSLAAKPESREKLTHAFFAMMETIRPDITEAQVKRIEIYIRALTADAGDAMVKIRKEGL